jgi:hypothetical protein
MVGSEIAGGTTGRKCRGLRGKPYDLTAGDKEDFGGVLDATGFFDKKRRTSLARQQGALLCELVFRAEDLGRGQEPPADVRPGDIPEPAQRPYTAEEILAL